jgi:hypothetical protein
MPRTGALAVRWPRRVLPLAAVAALTLTGCSVSSSSSSPAGSAPAASSSPSSHITVAIVPKLLGLSVFEANVKGANEVAASLTTWCAISAEPCWPGGLAGVGYRSAARSETSPAMAV